MDAAFNEELQLVDAGKAFTTTIDAVNYGVNEWSVDGYAITAGSDAALEHGASEALYAMGFRHYTPVKTVRPATVPAAGVTLAKQEFIFPYMLMFQNYGYGGILEDEYKRWAVLNNCFDTRRPVSHEWSRIINWVEDTYDPGYYTVDHPDYLLPTGVASFNLTDATARAANLDICEQYILQVGINAQQRAAFDPTDGDTQSSDLVYAFANDVATRVRQTHANALLGVYAYAGHRTPVSFACPHLYVQVATGFNDLGIGYRELIRQWGLVAAEVAIRGYGDIAAQDGFRIAGGSGIVRKEFFTGDYPAYIAGGANGVNMETTGNWAKNIVSHYHGIRYWKYGNSTYDAEVADMLPLIYGNDAKVVELFDLWGTPAIGSVYPIAQSNAIIEAMADSEHKTEFERYMSFVMMHWQNDTLDRDGPYFTKLEENLRHVWAVRNEGTIHSYAYARQEANNNTSSNGRDDLSFDQDPNWEQFPALIDETRRQELLTHFAAVTDRPVELDDTELVLVPVAPVGAAASSLTEASNYVTLGVCSFMFYGPGTVTVTYTQTYRGSEILNFGEGLHEINLIHDATTTWSGGMLFLSLYPTARLDPGVGHRWAYLPKMTNGKYLLSSEVRITLYDEVGRKDIINNFPPFVAGYADPQSLVPGVVRVDNVNTRGVHSFGTVNPYISPSPYTQLMPKALALREFPNLTLGNEST